MMANRRTLSATNDELEIPFLLFPLSVSETIVDALAASARDKIRMSATSGFTHDVIVIVPGIMGSELAEDGTVLWGLSARACFRVWSDEAYLRRLHVSDAEFAGRTGRVTATRLLRFPAWAPWLAGIEPYTALVSMARDVVAHSSQVLEFPYDWRLSVQHNATLLADAAMRRLQEWRADPLHEQARARHPDGRPARLMFVAHSMGGLLVRALSFISGITEEIQATVTLGTPFHGAVKAAVILNSGRGVSLPPPRAKLRERLRQLAVTLPGVHDLLPTYACVDLGNEVVSLTPADVAALGGDLELARQSADLHARLRESQLVGHHAVVGVEQRTMQTFTLDGGVVTAQYHGYERDSLGALRRDRRGGDGTVYRDSADLGQIQALPQQHGALAKTTEAIAAVRDILLRRDAQGPRLGAGDIGLDVPDIVEPGIGWTAEIGGVDNLAAVTCELCELTGSQPGQLVNIPTLSWEDGQVRARIIVPQPGLYRLEVNGGAMSPVSQIVMAADPNM